MYNANNFFFPFFSAGLGGRGAGLHDAHKYSQRAQGQIYFFFITFLLISCVCNGVWGVGRVAKRQGMFFFFDGKGNAKSNRIGT
jgi:hypothetical protein